MEDLGTAKNRGTKVITGTLTDNSSTEIPASSITSLVWSLTDEFGNVINSREDVSMTPANPFTVLLTPDDNDQEDSPNRVFSIVAVYNSVEYGSGLEEPQQGEYTIGEWITPEETV